MGNLNFSGELKEYCVNGCTTIHFNPADPAFVEKAYNAFTEMDKIQEEHRKRVKDIGDSKEIFEVIRESDRKVREMLDGLFGEPVCGEIFKNMSVFALSDGFPVWANFMLAILDECNRAADEQQKQSQKRISKYTARYHK